MSTATLTRPPVVSLPAPESNNAPTQPERDPYALLAQVPPMKLGGLRLGQTIPSALQALRANKGRSLLTALGIIIGVAAVIAVVALGEGASASVGKQLQSLGTNLLTISPGAARTGGVSSGAGGVNTLTSADATNLLQDVPGIQADSPVVQSNAQVIFGAQNWSTRISGVTPSYEGIESWSISSGAFFTEQQDQDGAAVAVLGQTVVTSLFPNGQDPVGQLIQIRNVPFTVIGVLNAKGTAGFGQDQDDTVLVPLHTAQVRLTGTQTVNSIVVAAADPNNMTNLQTAIDTDLRQLHKLASNKPDDFTIRNNASVIQQAEGVTQTLTLLLGGVAVVSLVVGGIGIMNIMLVSVTERTREIGIRAAIGAQPFDILAQFLMEALIISIMGGLLGILLGGGLAYLLPTFGWATAMSWTAVGLAFVFSAAIGVFFGIYPARKAAQLDPIVALRYQ